MGLTEVTEENIDEVNAYLQGQTESDPLSFDTLVLSIKETASVVTQN